MKTVTHTPLPWRLRMNDSGMCNGVAVSATVLPPEPFTGPYIAEVGSSRANAEFIVRACNSHEELLAALKALTVACVSADSIEELPPEIDGSLIDAARAAIAKAEGL
jgi:hypothetical protein